MLFLPVFVCRFATGSWNGQRSNEPEIEEGLSEAESIQVDNLLNA